MGATQSTTSVDVVNNSIVSIATNITNACSSSTNASQTVNITGSTLIGTTINDTISVSQSCMQNLTLTSQNYSDMASQILQDASSNNVALLPSYSGADAHANLTSALKSSISTNFIQTSAASLTSTSTVNVTGSTVKGSTINIGVSALQTAMISALNNTGVAQKIVADTSQTASSTANTNPFALSGNTLYIVIAIVMCIILVSVFGGAGQKKNDKKSPDSVAGSWEEILKIRH